MQCAILKIPVLAFFPRYGILAVEIPLVKEAGPMIPVDYHMHTDSSPDSDAPAIRMCEAALAHRLTHIAITDHVELVDFEKDGYAARAERSFREQTAAQTAFAGRLHLVRGVEIGCPLYDEATANRLLSQYDYGFVLVSQHQLDDQPDFYFCDFTQLDIPVTLDRYFESVLQVARWGRFHSLAHLTYPLRYIPAALQPADYTRWLPVIDEIFRTLIRADRALEINTSGLRKGGVTAPDFPLIRRYRERGGRLLTFGSDAHRPEDVGAGIEEAARLARQAGFTEVALFDGPSLTLLPL